MTQNQRASEELSWKLMGIAQERKAVEERLNYLNEQERSLRSGQANGRTTATAKTAAPTNTPKRKRKISPEQRQKMSEAAKKRWANTKRTEEANATQVPPPVTEMATV